VTTGAVAGGEVTRSGVGTPGQAGNLGPGDAGRPGGHQAGETGAVPVPAEPPAVAAWLESAAFRDLWDSLGDDGRERARGMTEDWMVALPPPVGFGKVRITWPAGSAPRT